MENASFHRELKGNVLDMELKTPNVKVFLSEVDVFGTE